MLSFFVKKKKMSSIIKKMNRTTNEIKICDSIKKIINSFHLLSDIDEIKMLDTGMCVKSVVYAKFLFNIYSHFLLHLRSNFEMFVFLKVLKKV